MTKILTWLATTRVGRGLLAVFAVLAAIGIAAWHGFEEGKFRAARADAKRRVQDAADAAKVARDTYTKAAAAADQVRQGAAAAPPPDAGKRDDLDNQF